MQLFAVFTHDTRKYHVYQILEEEKKVVGTLYYRKDVPLPVSESFEIINPADDRFVGMIKTLIDRARDGSKGQQRLIDAIAGRENE